MPDCGVFGGRRTRFRLVRNDALKENMFERGCLKIRLEDCPMAMDSFFFCGNEFFRRDDRWGKIECKSLTVDKNLWEMKITITFNLFNLCDLYCLSM